MPVSYAVTGASRGLGLEFVTQLSALPDTIVFAFARNPSSATKLQDLQAQRKNLHIVKVDINNLQELKEAAQRIAEKTDGKLDYLINNAVYINPATAFTYPSKYPTESLASDLATAFETNVIGVAQTISTFLPLLKAGDQKRVISLSTGIAEEELTRACGLATNLPYCVTKHALNLLMLKYALDLKDEGFIFLTISPGFVNTAEEGPAPPPEIAAEIGKMVGQFKAVYPHFEGAITPEESVKQLLNVFSQLKPEHNGNFCSHLGPTSKQWL